MSKFSFAFQGLIGVGVLSPHSNNEVGWGRRGGAYQESDLGLLTWKKIIASFGPSLFLPQKECFQLDL